jgi:hypothetical protein
MSLFYSFSPFVMGEIILEKGEILSEKRHQAACNGNYKRLGS